MKKTIKILLLSIMVLSLIFAFACGDKKGNDNKTEQKLEITNTETSYNLGDKITFKAKKTGIEDDVVLKWSSSDETVISITETTGKAVAKKVGSTTIKVTAGEISAELKATVKNDIVPVLTLAKEKVTIFVGEKDRPSPILKYNNQIVHDAVYTYSTKDTDVITLAEDGGITALIPGVAEIVVKAEYRYNQLTATYTVEVASTINEDTDLRAPFDFATLNTEREIEKVVDDEGNVVPDSKITFTQTDEVDDTPYKTDVSTEAKKFIVYYKDGYKNKVNLTVWSLVIKTPQDLLDMNKYEVVTKTVNGQKRATYGIYKLANDIDMTDLTFCEANCLGMVDNSNYGGFTGLIDGQGHKISNLTYEDKGYMGLAYVLSRGAVVRDIKIDCAYIKGLNSGVITAVMNGGVIKNAEVTIQSVGYTEENLKGGAVVGALSNAGSVSILMENVTMIFKGNKSGNWTNFSALGVISLGEDEFKADLSQLKLTNVNIVGFNKLSGIIGKSTFTKLEEVQEYATCENVKLFTDVAEMENANK